MANNERSGITYKLKRPLVQGSETVTELHFVEPTLGLLKKADGCKGDLEKVAKLIEVLCNIRPGLVDLISPVDIQPIGEIIAGFFPASQQT